MSDQKIMFVFPGQGSQYAGMSSDLCAEFPVARRIYEQANQVLGYDIQALSANGPEEELGLTRHTQPALLTHSIACLEVFRDITDAKDQPVMAGGHSLGEYSALCAAGVFTLADTARLLRIRGRAMQSAVPVGQGAMAALLGVGLDVARTVAAEAAQGEVCDVANDNEPTQVVLSGHKTAIDRVAAVGKAHGLRRAIPLPVSAPFHCRLLQPAAEAMAAALAR